MTKININMNGNSFFGESQTNRFLIIGIMKSTGAFFVLFFLLQSVLAQNRLLTMEEAIIKQKSSLAPAKLKQLQWIKGSDQFSFIDKKENAELLVVQNATDKIPRWQLSLAELNDALKDLTSLTAFPLIRWRNKNEFTFELEKKVIRYDLNKKKHPG